VFRAAIAAAVVLWAAATAWAGMFDRGGEKWTLTRGGTAVVYASYSQGYAFSSMDEVNRYYIDGYARDRNYFHEHVIGAQAIEAELGTFVGEAVRMGVSYVFMRASTGDSAQIDFNDVIDGRHYEFETDFRFLDLYFRGVGFGVDCYALSAGRFRVSVGARQVLGKGYSHLGYGRRPDVTRGDYGDWNYEGYGVGLTGELGVHVYPTPNLALGVVGGYRALRTEVMQSVTDGAPWRRPPGNPHNIVLDFSGFVVRGKVSVEL
jgi:hypothetical protein